MPYSEELRLLWFVLLNATALATAWRIADAFGSGSLSKTILDTLLLNFVIQYTVVCGLGVFGILSPVSISIATVILAGVVFATTMKRKRQTGLSQLIPEGRIALAILIFGCGYLAAYCVVHGDLPIVETDAIAYHLPTALGWLHSGHLKLFESWYWNPANTYSPLAAEAFMVWLWAPMNAEVLVKFVQAPALVIVALGMYRIARELNCRPIGAACLGVATMLSRPFFAEGTLIKDDVWVAAFMVCAVVALGQQKRDRLTPIRAGCALAMLMATKYPALLTLPVVLLAIRRWPLRDWMIVIAIITLLAGPWYLRNWIAYGNPLFPMILKVGRWTVFDGKFNVMREAATRTPMAVWRMATGPYFGAPVRMLIGLCALWVVAIVWHGLPARAQRMGKMPMPPTDGQRIANSSLVGFALIGPVLGPLVFTLLSPHPEIRYFFPFLLPLFAAVGVLLAGTHKCVQLCIAIALAVWAVVTNFEWRFASSIVEFASAGFIAAVVALAAVWFWKEYQRIVAGGAVAIVLVAGLYAFVNWNSYVARLADSPHLVWPDRYGDLAPVWLFARDQLPADARIAYVNTNLIYPLMGPRGQREVFYVPTRAGEKSFDDLLRIGDRVPQDRIVPTVTAAMNDGADAAIWLANLRARGVQYIYVAKHQLADDPPELRFIRDNPALFQQVSPPDDTAVVYRFIH